MEGESYATRRNRSQVPEIEQLWGHEEEEEEEEGWGGGETQLSRSVQQQQQILMVKTAGL